MSELLGLLLILGLMTWILRFMTGVRSGRRRGFKRYERPPARWWRALVWVPIGYSLAKLLGSGTPLSIVVITSILLAFVQRMFPRPFEIVIGGGGALVALGEALDGSGCREPISGIGLVLVFGFASVAAVSVVVSGRPILKSGQYLSAGAAMIELTLFVVSPIGGVLVDTSGPLAVMPLIVVLLVSLMIGRSPTVGLAVVGAGLIAGQTLLALSPGACDRTALHALVGALAFAASRMVLSRRGRRSFLGVR